MPLFSWLPYRKKFWCPFLKKHWLWWSYIDHIFMIWHHRKNELKQFIGEHNKFHPAIKFTCDYSLENNEISTDLYVKKLIVISTSIYCCVTHAIVLRQFLIVNPYDSTKYV